MFVEVGSPTGPELGGGDVLGGERADGPACGGVQVRAGSAEGAHERGADGGGQGFGVVEVVGGGEEGVVEGAGEVGQGVDHGAFLHRFTLASDGPVYWEYGEDT